jgi:cephalosporin hydroxylase
MDSSAQRLNFDSEHYTDMTGTTFDFCPELASLLQTQRAVGKTGRIFEDLASLSTPRNLHTIRELLYEFRPERTLEIGLCFGGSALVCCSTHKEVGFPPRRQHTAIDPYQTTRWDSCGLMAVERAGLMGYLNFSEAYSALQLPRLVEGGARFGLVYVDGSHLFEDVFVDAYFAIRLLIQGGVIAFDDSSNPHIAKVLRYLRTNLRGALKELDLSKYREERGRVTYRVARYFGKVQLTAFRRVGNVERAWDAAFHSF